MAMKLEAGKVGRGDEFRIFPENIVVVPGENSRKELHTPEEIKALADSILAFGQETPCRARRIEGNRVQLVSGYGRHAAVTYLNTKVVPDDPIPLRVLVSECSQEDAFVRSIIENLQRAETTPVDDLYAQKRLREVYGWSDTKIAQLYQSSVTWVRRMAKTSRLSTPLKEKVEKGELPLTAALDLTDIPEAEREAVVQEATNPITGQANGAKVKAKVRAVKRERGQTASRTLKEVRDFLMEQMAPRERDSVRELARALVDFAAGKISAGKASAAFDKHCRE